MLRQLIAIWLQDTGIPMLCNIKIRIVLLQEITAFAAVCHGKIEDTDWR